MFTCHSAEVIILPLPQAETCTRFSNPGGMQGWVDLRYVKADRLGSTSSEKHWRNTWDDNVNWPPDLSALHRAVYNEQVSNSNLAKGRIADLSPLAAVNGFVRSNNGSLDPQESAFKRHLDRFTRLRSLSACLTHRHTDHVTCDICRSRPHLCYACDAD